METEEKITIRKRGRLWQAVSNGFSVFQDHSRKAVKAWMKEPHTLLTEGCTTKSIGKAVKYGELSQ